MAISTALAGEVQAVIKLKFYEDLQLKEIADTNLSTAKARLYDELKNLKLSIKEEEL